MGKIGNIQVYQVNWSWNKDVDKWLRKISIGRTLNFPCGMSKVGDVKTLKKK